MCVGGGTEITSDSWYQNVLPVGLSGAPKREFNVGVADVVAASQIAVRSHGVVTWVCHMHACGSGGPGMGRRGSRTNERRGATGTHRLS